MGKLGIDFGTSNSTLCALDKNGRVTPICERGRGSNQYKIPTVAYYCKNGTFRYGTPACNMYEDEYGMSAEDTPEALLETQSRIVKSIKRRIGVDGSMSFPGRNGETVEISISDILTGFFKYFKDIASEGFFKFCDDSIQETCISHPVDFTQSQVDIIIDCAKAAGLPNVIVVEEPVAAALACAADMGENAKSLNGLLIYDFGGGTFDLAFVHRDISGQWRVPVLDGDSKCGGDDIDRAIYGEMERRIAEKTGDHEFRFSETPGMLNLDILRDCQELKEQMSEYDGEDGFFRRQISSAAREVVQDKAWYNRTEHKALCTFRFTNDEFESLIGDRIQHTVDLVVKMIQEIRSKGYVADRIILIGGSSAIPLITKRLKKCTSLEIVRPFDADVAVAKGTIQKTMQKVSREKVEQKALPVVRPRVKPISLKDTWERKGKMANGVCRKCKHPIYKGELFCRGCGTLLNGIPGVKDATLVSKVEDRLKRLVAFDKEFELSPEYCWDETVARYANTIGRLKAILENKSFVFSKNVSKKTISHLDLLLSKCRDAEFHIALVGTIKAGKSTLINAMLGGNYASVSVTPETAVLTKFRSSRDKNRICVIYYTQKEWNEIWAQVEALKKSSPDKVRMFRTGYEELNADSVKSKFLDRAPEEYAYPSEYEMIDDLQKLTSSKSADHYFIKEVTVYLSKLELPDKVVFVDTPGLNDVLEYRSNITKAYIARANAVLVCVDAARLEGNTLDLIYQVFDNVGSNEQKVYVIGTQIDKLNKPLSQWAQIKNEWVLNLEGKVAYGSKMTARKNIIGVAAYKVIQLSESENNEDSLKEVTSFAELKLNYDITSCDKYELKRKIQEFSNVALLKERLKQEIISRAETLMKDDIRDEYYLCIKEVRAILESLCEKSEELKKATLLGANELERKIKDINDRLAEKEQERLRAEEEKNRLEQDITDARKKLLDIRPSAKN